LSFLKDCGKFKRARYDGSAMPVSALHFALLAAAALLAAPGHAQPARAVPDPLAQLVAACASCHQIGPNERGGFGPQLNGLFGRRAGSTPDFTYSDAMKASGIVWDERTLSAFLRDPDKVVPGTKMRFWGIHDDRDMAALLAYLRTYQDLR
jgi:cytochrome c